MWIDVGTLAIVLILTFVLGLLTTLKGKEYKKGYADGLKKANDILEKVINQIKSKKDTN